MSKFKHDRPTIGILLGYSVLAGKTPDHYRASVLKGIQSAARARQCNLLVAWGLGRVTESNAIYPAWPTVSPDSDFVPVGPWNTDGLIVFAPIQHETRSRYLQGLREKGYPMVFIATGENGPTISVDNEAGIHQAVAHMAIDHGHHQIAFIAGHPDDKGNSESRLRAFRSALTDYGLDADPRLIAEGLHSVPGGYIAVQRIIQTGVTFTALIASNDACAIGAMQAIRETTSLQIPHDIAVIGFDDQPSAVAQIPPLASIHIPLMEIGQQALTLMSDYLHGHHELASVQIPTRLVRRQSCGCLPQAVYPSLEKKSPSQSSSDQPAIYTLDIHKSRDNLADEMIAALPHSLRFPFGEQTYRFCLNLAEAFLISIKEGSDTYFQEKLMDFLQEMEQTDENIDDWQNAISALRREVIKLPAPLTQTGIRPLAEDMLHEARSAISESAQRQVYRHQYHQQIADQLLGELITRLGTTLDERQTVKILEENLAEIGVRHVRVALFEADGDDPVGWSILLNPPSREDSHRFPSRSFPPAGLYPPDEILNLAIFPLTFQKESLGYVAFDASNLEPCATVARQLAVTFKISRLHTQVVELSLRDALTGIHNRRYFDLFLNNEVNRSRRLGHELAIIILDIDHFKTYNDTYGHPAGDKAIQNVVHYVTSGRRSGDTIARIGGEEFALILPETTIEGALTVAEKIRSAITDSSVFECSITVSMGISSSAGTVIETGTLLQQADSALYQAKRTGRNRVCVYQNEATVRDP